MSVDTEEHKKGGKGGATISLYIHKLNTPSLIYQKYNKSSYDLM